MACFDTHCIPAKAIRFILEILRYVVYFDFSNGGCRSKMNTEIHINFKCVVQTKFPNAIGWLLSTWVVPHWSSRKSLESLSIWCISLIQTGSFIATRLLSVSTLSAVKRIKASVALDSQCHQSSPLIQKTS